VRLSEPEDTSKNRIYFHGLDALRFFAALSVILAHIELLKFQLGLPNLNKEFQYINFGGNGVYFFFVLSGFLITYLLCAERTRFNTIAVRKFYLRRILRIWPLYFILVIFGFFILPQFHFFDLFYKSFSGNFSANLLLYIFILPNLAFSLYPPVPHIGHLWSIGVEEQFYIVWPLIVKYSRSVLKTIIVLMCAYLLFKAALLLMPAPVAQQKWFRSLRLFVGMSKFECMMTGALGGVILHSQMQNILAVIYNKFVLALSLILMPVLGFLSGYPTSLQNIMHIPLSFIFLVIIMNIATNPQSFIKVNSSFLNTLGRMSYGIYMYHFVIVFICVKSLKGLIIVHPALGNILLYLSSIVLSVCISAFSYRFIETYFIRLKTRFSKILSGA
jgi:peptidoglycan/LPS O-acetylase OafA/YrhL